MNQKGYTLIEMISIILLVSIVGCSLSLGSRWIKTVAFRSLVREVEHGIINAQQMAAATGMLYKVSVDFNENQILVSQGNKEPIYTFQIGDEVTISKDVTGSTIKFNGHMAPSGAKTIQLIHEKLGVKARITIRVATGKTTVYFEP